MTERRSEKDLHQLMLQLDGLEELLELMDELGVDSRAAAEARIAALHEQIDASEPA